MPAAAIAPTIESTIGVTGSRRSIREMDVRRASVISYEFLASDVSRVYRQRLHDEADAWRRARDARLMDRQGTFNVRKLLGTKMIRAGARVAGVADDDCFAIEPAVAPARA
jgi:hypothetical protein